VPSPVAVALLAFVATACASTPPNSVTAATDAPAVLETPTGRILGSMEIPAAAGPVPVALIIAGSGPTDRNGNIGGMPGANDSYRMLARALAERGIASVRYDKRGIAASGAAATSEAELRFETYVEDAAGWIRLLREDPRFSTVTVVGHSEGSLIGMLAARQAGADGFVSLAGVARPAAEVLRDQLRPALPPALWEESERILAGLERGEQTPTVPAELVALYRPSVQPYLISWFRYHPADEIARLTIPALVVQGTTDVQVGVAEAEALARGREGARLVIIEGMNHVLKRVSGDRVAQQPSYFDPSLPLVPEVVEAVGAFVRELQ
jgi:pimeloyl-ACP methyl ester carboxylesterase